MNKLLTIDQAAKLSRQFRQKGKSVILVGGCFDVLHAGHLFFLKTAKKGEDLLLVLLESDESIKKRKGETRPINSLKKRAAVLSSAESVDFVIPLSGVTKDEEYDRLMLQIQPNVVAMTQGDKSISQRQKQCKLVGARIKLVDRIEGISTSALINING